MNNDSMNSRFKSYNYKLFVASLVALAPLGANAKTAQTSESDTASADKEMVQVAYRKVAKDDILGGVSVVDVENLMKKNYHTYSLDNMQGYVGGWNGNSLWGMDADNAGYLVLVDGVKLTTFNQVRLHRFLSSRVRRLWCSMVARLPRVL